MPVTDYLDEAESSKTLSASTRKEIDKLVANIITKTKALGLMMCVEQEQIRQLWVKILSLPDMLTRVKQVSPRGNTWQMNMKMVANVLGIMMTYQKMGYPEDWIHQRLLAIRIRNELTDEWQKRGVEKGKEYAILTDEITKAWSGLNTRQYKNLKGLKKENLRDNMTDTELVLNMLAEASTRDISKKEKPQGLEANRNVAKRGGAVAGTARKNLEKETGESVISNQNAVTLGYLVNNLFLDVVKDKEE